MGRAEKRRMERRERLESRKEKVLLSRDDIYDIREDAAAKARQFDIEALMTVFALTNHRLYGHGRTRTMRTLQYVDDLMADILNDRATIEDYKKMLEDEAGVAVKC